MPDFQVIFLYQYKSRGHKIQKAVCAVAVVCLLGGLFMSVFLGRFSIRKI